MKSLYPCPCCRFLTLSDIPPGTFEICSVCGWEDDEVQYMDPDFSGGANRISLNEARNNYKSFGASCKEKVRSVRTPLPGEIP